MSNSIRPTKASTLITVGVVTGMISWALVRGFYGDIPPFRWYAPVSIGLIAAAEAVYAAQLKRRLEAKPGTEPIEPLSVAHAVGYAKASAIVGALLTGAWAGLVAYTGAQAGYLAAAGADATVGAFGVVCGLGLTGAGLYLERCCRTPANHSDD